MRLLPTFAGAKRSNVRDVVAAMPGIMPNHIIKRHLSQFRMLQAARKILRLHRAGQYIPPIVERFQEREGNLNGCIARVLQLRPETLIIGLDRRFVLSERKLKSHVRIHMAVWDMVDDLPNRPSAGAIGRVKLLLRKSCDSVPQSLRRRCNPLNRTLALDGSQRLFVLVFPDRVTQIHLGVWLVHSFWFPIYECNPQSEKGRTNSSECTIAR